MSPHATQLLWQYQLWELYAPVISSSVQGGSFNFFFSLHRYCIPSGVDDITNDRMLRLNLNAHPLSYVNDQDLGTAWLSKVMSTQELEEGITITVDLANGQYQVLQLFLYIYIWIASILRQDQRSEVFAQIQIQQCIHLHCLCNGERLTLSEHWVATAEEEKETV